MVEFIRIVVEVFEVLFLLGILGIGVFGLIRVIRDSESRFGEYSLTLVVFSLVEILF